ncbi:MAG: hypothetical protein ACJAWT_001386 [Glaciecola sp.]|jgi:hypothetical protein
MLKANHADCNEINHGTADAIRGSVVDVRFDNKKANI